MKILQLFVLILLTPFLLLANSQNIDVGVYRLTQQGWQITKKESFVDKRPGLKPYQNLTREVQVVLYSLHRDENILFCRVEYDSQRDTHQEFCAPSPREATEQFIKK